MSNKEKIFLATTFLSLIIAGSAIGLMVKNQLSQAEVSPSLPTQESRAPLPPADSGETVPLLNGWNLINLPWNFPPGTTISQIFSNSPSLYTLRNGEWTNLASSDPVTPSLGILVKTSASTNLTIKTAGAAAPASPYTENIDQGYSLITNPFFQKETVSLPVVIIKDKKYTAKEAIDQKLVRLYRWNPALQKFEPLGGGELLKKFEAVLVKTNHQATCLFYL